MYHPKLEKEIRCPLEYGLAVFGGKWKARILCVLSEKQVLRYSALRAQMTDIADPVLAAALHELIAEHFRNRHELSNMVAVATDAGGAKRTGRFSEKLGIPMAIIDKRRVSDTAVKQGAVVGEVAGRDVVIFEDEIATAGTLVSSVDTLKAAGARSIHAAATHGVLCGPAIERLRAAAIDSVVVTNTVALPEDKRLDKLTVLNVAPLFAAAIERIHSGQSVGALFE